LSRDTTITPAAAAAAMSASETIYCWNCCYLSLRCW